MGARWAETTLDELIASGVVLLGRGNVISKKDMEANPGPYPVYSSAQNNDGRIGSYNNFMFDEELITWSIDGGGYVFYRPRHKFSVTNIGGYLRILDESKLLYQFLAAVLQGLHGQQAFDWQNKAHPSVIRKLYNQIPLPPFIEQKRIVHVMAAVNVYIAALQQQAEDARTARNAVLHELMVAGGDDWTETTLGDVVGIQKGKKPLLLNDDNTTGQPYLTADVLRGSAPSQFIPQSVLGACVQLGEEETVLLWDGAGAGDVFKSTTGVLASTMARLLNKTTRTLNTDYLHLAVMNKSPEIKSSCRGTTVPHVSPSALAAITIMVPSLQEQKRIVEIVTAMDDVVGTTEQAIAHAKLLRSGLLSDLLSGEHEIPATYDRLLGAA